MPPTRINVHGSNDPECSVVSLCPANPKSRQVQLRLSCNVFSIHG